MISKRNAVNVNVNLNVNVDSGYERDVVYNSYILFWATVETISPEMLWTTWWTIAEGRGR